LSDRSGAEGRKPLPSALGVRYVGVHRQTASEAEVAPPSVRVPLEVATEVIGRGNLTNEAEDLTIGSGSVLGRAAVR